MGLPTPAAKGWRSPWGAHPMVPLPHSSAGTQLCHDLERHLEKLLRSPEHPSAGPWVSPDPLSASPPERSVPLRILYEKYGENLTQDNLIKVVALLTEYQTGDIIVAVRDVYIKNPEIKIRVRTQAGLGGGRYFLLVWLVPVT